MKVSVVTLLAAALVAATVGAQPPVKVPPTKGFTAEVDALIGQALLLDRAFADVLKALAADDLKQMAGAYGRLVRNHTQMADRLVDAHLLIGQAHSRLDLASGHLDWLRRNTGKGSPRVTAGLALLRAELLETLHQARQRYELAPACSRPDMLHDLQHLANHLEQLDAWTALVREGKVTLVAPEQVARLEGTHRELVGRLAREKRLLDQVAVGLVQAVRDLPGELEVSLRLLRLQATLPHDQLARLERQRTLVGRFVKEVQAARSELVRGLVPPEAKVVLPTPEVVLRRVDALLSPVPSGKK